MKVKYLLSQSTIYYFSPQRIAWNRFLLYKNMTSPIIDNQPAKQINGY